MKRLGFISNEMLGELQRRGAQPKEVAARLLAEAKALSGADHVIMRREDTGFVIIALDA